MWKASALCHKPLYFEDEALERYGHSWGPCLDPLVSGAHFFCKLPVLPYCMGVHPPNECMYALGHYRPGNCAPYMMRPDADQLPRSGVPSGRGGRCGGDPAVAPSFAAAATPAAVSLLAEIWTNWIFGTPSRNTIHRSKNRFFLAPSGCDRL